jgi:hypothetical protein
LQKKYFRVRDERTDENSPAIHRWEYRDHPLLIEMDAFPALQVLGYYQTSAHRGLGIISRATP